MRTTPFKLPDPILLPTPDRNIDNSTATDVDCTADSRHPAPLDKKQTHITTRPFPRCSIVLPALQRKLPIHRNHSLPVDAAFPPPAVLLPQVHRRFAYSLASTFLLFATAGPVAFLYSCLILIIELFCHKKRALWFISFR